jgi:drug/metabolite transporter (DMT)-like permease
MHLLMLVATVCWAGNIVAGKEALKGFDPFALTQLRVGGAALLYVLLFVAQRKALLPRLRGREWGLLAALAACGVTFNQLFFIAGLARTSGAHAGLIVALIPVIVLVVACSIRLEALTLPKLLGMMIAFMGVAILTLSKAGQGNGASWQGDMLLLGATMTFAIYTILVKKVIDRYRPVALNAIIFPLGAALMLPLGLPDLLRTDWGALSFSSWWGLTYMVVFGSGVAYLVFAVALTELAASRVAAFGYLQPMIATGLVIWLLGERISASFVLSGVLILTGVYLAERERGEEEISDGGEQGTGNRKNQSPLDAFDEQTNRGNSR